jgi:hypothetical protein
MSTSLDQGLSTVQLSSAQNGVEDGLAEASLVQGEHQQSAKCCSKVVVPSSADPWTQVLNLNYQLGSVIDLHMRIYRTTNRGIKVVVAALIDMGGMLENRSWIKMKKTMGGVIVAELMVDRATATATPMESFPSVARFRLQTLRLSNPQSNISDTIVEVSKLDKGLWVKVDRFGDSLLELDTTWNWPVRITVHDSRSGIVLGSCVEELHDLLFSRTKPQLALRNGNNDVVGEIELKNLEEAIKPLPDTPLPKETSFNNVCIAIDFTSTNRKVSDPSSLHAIRPEGNGNAYQVALLKVAKLFSTKQTYTPWGFGAKIEGKVRHIFQCGQTETAMGSHGLQVAYQDFLSTRPLLDGPKVLDQVIKAASTKGRVLVVLSDFVGIDVKQLQRLCEKDCQLRIILVGLCTRPHLSQLDGSTLGKNIDFLSVDSL